MKRFLFSTWLILIGSCCYAQTEPNQLVGDTILFYRTIGNVDCYFDISVLNNYKFSKKNRFESINGFTQHSSFENRWLIVDSLLLHKSDTLLLLRRLDDDTSFVLFLPLINTLSKKSVLQNHIVFHLEDNPSFFDPFRKKIIFSYSLKCEKMKDYKKLINELISSPLKSMDTTILEPFSSYKLISYDLKSTPIKIVFKRNNSERIALTYQQLDTLIQEKIQRNEDVRILNDHIAKYNTALIDSVNYNHSNKSFWFKSSILGLHWNYTGDMLKFPPSVLKNSRNELVETYTGDAAPYCYDWPNKNGRTFSEGMIGGGSWSFFKAKLIGIRLMPTIITSLFITSYDSKNEENKRSRKKLEKWGKYNYYFVVVPDKSSIYKVGMDYEKVPGYELKDTLFIPYTQEKINNLLSDANLAEFEKTFRQSEQDAWDTHMTHYTSKYEIIKKAYGKEIADIVCKGEVRFGFTPEMCDLAYEGEPYKIIKDVHTPLGNATVHNFYTKDIKLYFIDNLLIGILWKDGKIRFK